MIVFTLCMVVLVAALIMTIFAQITGWRTLARTFPAPPAAAGKRVRSQGVVLGAWPWNAPPLRVVLDDRGVRLEPRRPFDLAFRPVEVPWDAIRGVARRQFMLFDVVEVRYGPEPEAVLGFLAGPAADAVAERAGESSPAASPSR